MEPENYVEKELKSLLWTASEFKLLNRDEFNKINSMENKSATFLLSSSKMLLQSAIHNAAEYVRLPLKIIVDSKWENWRYTEDVGRILGKTTDIIFLHSNYQVKAKMLAKGAEVPVILVESKRYKNIRALSDILTFYETFGFLNNLPVCWIGGATPLINTYLCLVPRLGIELKVFCAVHPDVKESPALESKARSQGQCFLSNVKMATTFQETLKGTKILVIGHHEDPKLQLNLTKCKEAAENFYIMHCMPRGEMEIEQTLFESDKNLTWSSYKNMQWIFAAFMVRCLTEYKHITESPKFGKSQS